MSLQGETNRLLQCHRAPIRLKNFGCRFRKLLLNGQIKNIPSAEITYFREWAALQAFIERWLRVEEAVKIDE